MARNRPNLTDEDRAAIVEMARSNRGIRQKIIAAEFGISVCSVSMILTKANQAVPRPVPQRIPADPFKYTSFAPDPAKLRAGR